jgi:hypothetical protein
MKTLLGFGLIILGVVSFFIYLFNYGFTSINELIGVLIGLAIFVIPGILLFESGAKSRKR